MRNREYRHILLQNYIAAHKAAFADDSICEALVSEHFKTVQGLRLRLR
jgi:hypothetical protein